MRRHLGRLGLHSIESYGKWCASHGLATTTDKSPYDLEEELQAFDHDKARAAAQTRLHHNPRKLIEAACAGTISPDEITRPRLHEFCCSIHASPSDAYSREALSKLLLKVNGEADFLLEGVSFGGRSYRYVDALIKLNRRRWQWIAPLDSWRPGSHNARKQFSSLVRHLLARFPVPAFMDQVWFRSDADSERLREWFVHLGAGKNIRTVTTPIPLTKIMAHHFLKAPDNYSIEGAIRWGQVHALGGDRQLIEALLGTRIGQQFEHNEFWTSVIRFFVVNPLLDRRHVGPIVDFLHSQRFETREIVVAPGEVELQPPPQPNLTMRGRTAQGLLAQVERWHRDLGRAMAAENLYFKRSGVKELALKTGANSENVWNIRELLSGADLIAEGKALQHCVASYARSCATGRCSIWAMELHTPLGTEKRLTIELRGDGIVTQCRGKRNRLPTAGEFEVLKDWVRHAGLTISPYVRAGA
jgi:PcfJ-like protein